MKKLKEHVQSCAKFVDKFDSRDHDDDTLSKLTSKLMAFCVGFLSTENFEGLEIIERANNGFFDDFEEGSSENTSKEEAQYFLFNAIKRGISDSDGSEDVEVFSLNICQAALDLHSQRSFTPEGSTQAFIQLSKKIKEQVAPALRDKSHDLCDKCGGKGRYIGFQEIEDPCKACGGSGINEV